MIDLIRKHFWKTSLSLRYPKIIKIYQVLEKSQWWERDQIIKLQDNKLRNLLEHAFKCVPFYRELWKSVGFKPADFNRHTFQQLPLLTKQDIKQHIQELTCLSLQSRALFNSTGGSTGEPLQFYQDRIFPTLFYAAAIRHNRWTGWQPGEAVLRLWGNPADTGYGCLRKLNRRLMGYTIFNAFQLSEEAFDRAYLVLTRKEPTLLIGYATAVAAFAGFIRSNKKPPQHSLRGIITSAEILTDEMRRLIEETFKVKVFDRYGCREVGLIASQCEMGSYHINDENIFLEVIELENGVKEFVVTDLNNKVMPFIRYRIGDIGHLSQEQCACGRGLGIIKVVSGRTTDILVTAEGKIISGPSLTLVFKDIKEVEQVQLYQPARGILSVRIVPGEKYDKNTETLILTRIRRYFGEESEIGFSMVKEIPREASGKYRFSVSDVYRS